MRVNTLVYFFSFLIGLAVCIPLQGQNFASDKVVVRLKSGSEKARTSTLQSLQKNYNVKIRQAITWANPEARERHSLADIYFVEVPPTMSVKDWLEILQNENTFAYVEPYIEHELLYTPNDPQAATNGGQDYLALIEAYDAWSITRGNSNIIIGILDSGTKTDHEDLSQNVAINTNDPINGVDDDQDGYIDNYWGWDMADNDNNPSPGMSGHGTFVAGVSSAKADNGKGMAGIGFNSPYMPIKIYRSSDNRFMGGYEAIAYAADMGCKVINLSWGSASSYLQYAQDIINYAVLEKDVVIVAAAGNTNAELDFYPASYENVLSVGAATMTDTKAVWATYSSKIDLMAPGNAIYSTSSNGTYSKDNGSSFAAPMVAGAAALVRARFPNLNAQQIMERIRITADESIYQIPENQTYIDKLGRGRLNMYRALSDEGIHSVRISNYAYQNQFGNYVFAGDTLLLTLEIKNWLSAVGGLKVKIESKTDAAEVITPAQNIGTMASLSQAMVNNGFQVVIKDNVAASTRIDLKISFEGNGYQDYQYITIYTSPETVKISNHLSQISINKNGRIGNGGDAESNQHGIFYNKKKVADHIGLLIATSAEKVSDNTINQFEEQFKSNDFETQELLKLQTSSTAYFEVRNTLKEKATLSNKTGILVEQKLLAWPDKSHQNAWVIEYRITNTTSSPITNVYVGNLMDVNIGNRSQNKIDYQASRKMLYAYGVDGEPIYLGLAPLSTYSFTAMAIDVGSFNGNTSQIANSIDNAIKYNLLQQGESLSKTRAGINGVGNNVASLIGNKILNLPAYGSVKLAFAYSSGNSLDELEDGVDSAQYYYQQYISEPAVAQTLFACPNSSITINPLNGDRFDFYADKQLTQKLFTGNEFTTGNLNRDTIFYIQNVDNLYKSDLSAIRILIKDALVNFSLPNDTLLLPAQGAADIQLTDLSQNISIWEWNFDNGFQSSVANPKITYAQSGKYNITLTGRTAWGCQKSVQKELSVLRRAPLPEIVDEIRICAGTSANISASNTQEIRVYADPNKHQLIFEGSSYLSPTLNQDTVFYISNLDGEAESELKAVNIDVQLLTADFMVIPDTTNLTTTSSFKVINQSISGHQFEWYINNNLQSQETDPTLDFGNLTSFDLKVIAFSEFGCQMEKVIHFDTGSSTIPEFDNQQVCEDANFTIAPENGHIFYFYADENREILLKKGTQFSAQIQSDTLFYISNADGLIESELIEIAIDIIPVEAGFENIILFNTGSFGSKYFSAFNTTAKSWLWHIDGQVVSTKQAFEYNFPLEGEYLVKLTVTSQEGCKGSSEQMVEVDIISGIESLENQIKVYPNPNNGIFEIDLGQIYPQVNINIINLTGAIVHQGLYNLVDKSIKMDIHHLPRGLYLLRIESEGKSIHKKLQIEK